MLGDKNGGGSNHQTLNQILDHAVNDFGKSVAQHSSIFLPKKKTRPSNLNY
jgi:hypothetical protein